MPGAGVFSFRLKALLLGALSLPLAAQVQTVPSPQSTQAARSDKAARLDFRRLQLKAPLHFELLPDGRYLARSQGFAVAVDGRGAELALHGPDLELQGPTEPGHDLRPMPGSGERATLNLRLLYSAAHPELRAEQPLPSKSNYFFGSDPKAWRTDVAHAAKVRACGVYPGIDLVYYGQGDKLEYDFVVAPLADPSAIALAFDGAENIKLQANGDLMLHTKVGDLIKAKPVVYQVAGGQRVNVDGRYTLDQGRLRFALGAYDPTKELVIDPTLVFSSYLGGTYWDYGYAMAVDSAGSLYVAGNTDSLDFPVTPGTYQTSSGNGFLSKFAPDGQTLVYSTYLSGANPYSLAVGAAGQAHLTGEAWALPTTPGAYQTSYPGQTRAFLMKVNAAGNGLIYSTYLGASASSTLGWSVALDSSGQATVGGYTWAWNFPTTLGAFQAARPSANLCGFVTRFNASGSALVFSTFVNGSLNSGGGAAYSRAWGIAVDANGATAVALECDAVNFPTTPGAFQASRPRAC